MNTGDNWKINNPSGEKRILVTRSLPGEEWLNILSSAGYRTEVWVAEESLSREELIVRIGNNCTSVIGQLTEKWDSRLFEILRMAGGIAFCNYAVGFDNIDLAKELKPALTTMHVDKVLMGVIAVRHLIDRAANPNRAALKTLVSTQVIERETVRTINR